MGIVVRHFIVGFCSACLLVAASSAKADDQSIIAQGQEELRKAADALRPHPSSETTPADFTIAGVHYRVPRNYIVTMDKWAGGPQEVVTLRVTIPDLKPLDAGTSACLLAKPVERPPDCMPLDVMIEGSGRLTAEQLFNNMKDLFRNRQAMPAPSGLERYDVGPEDARLEEYHKIAGDRTIYYSCQTYFVAGLRRGFCQPKGDRTLDGTALNFFFDLRFLPDIEIIDSRLRKLVESFALDRQN